jgi:hypothetical protein
MNIYTKSIRWLLFSSVAFSLISGSQVIINMYDERMIAVVFFGLFCIAYVTFTTMLSLDLITKQIRTMKVIVLQSDKEIIKVLKPNAKTRRIRISVEEINKYEENQELELTLTKRTGQILQVNLFEDLMKR